MTLTELLANEELRQHKFPVTRDKIFLAHAGVCPLSHRVAGAVSECAQQGTLGDQESFVLHRLNDARKLGAQLLHCRPEEVVAGDAQFRFMPSVNLDLSRDFLQQIADSAFPNPWCSSNQVWRQGAESNRLGQSIAAPCVSACQPRHPRRADTNATGFLFFLSVFL
jgi:hypothetical protein